MYRNYNPNPLTARVGDCVIRAVSKVMDQSWEDTYIGLCLTGYLMGDLPSANNVWGAYLRKNRFKRKVVPDSCPDCYNVRQFAEDHPNGIYALATSGQVVASCGGDYFDTYDCGDDPVTFYWEKEE